MAAGVGGALAALTLWGNRRGTYDLRGRVVLITGGSRGLGLVLARQAVAEGARVAICARDEAELERARQELAELADDASAIMVAARDVTDPTDVRLLVAEVERRLGPVDVLINNAGIITAGPLENLDVRDFEECMNTHFWAPYHTMQAVLPAMRRRGEGRIVNISSLGGKVAIPHMAPYTASKFALTGLSEGFRTELSQHGIRVTTVCPGLLRTGSARQALVKGQQKKEYAVFSIADSMPGFTMSAEQAARQIWNATRRGDRTGPYRFVSWDKGAAVLLRRNADYAGPQPAWAEVSIRTIPNHGARVAALLAGDVDMIDAVTPPLQLRLAGDPAVVVSRTRSSRLIYLQVDAVRSPSPHATDPAGTPLPRNPLTDVRVRRAMSLALDRVALVQSAMDGSGVAAGQLLPDGYYGTDPALRPDPVDRAAARALLAEAGFPDGFNLVLHGPANRYPNDRAIGEAIGQMLSRAGIRTRFEPLPTAVFLTRAAAQDMSAILWGWASETSEPSGPLRALVATRDAARSRGTTNRLAWSDPALDALIDAALTSTDDAAREALLRAATGRAVRTGAILPVLFQDSVWALRAGLRHTANPLGYTLAARSSRSGHELPQLARDLFGRGFVGEVGGEAAARVHEVDDAAVVHVVAAGLGMPGEVDAIGLGRRRDLGGRAAQADDAGAEGAHIILDAVGRVALGVDRDEQDGDALPGLG